VKELSEAQQRILLHAAAAVKPGGKLVYAACTLSDLETMGVVRRFEEQCPQFKRLPVSNPLVPGSPPMEILSLWPQESGGNGMCVAVWTRSSD
jgi:16S rRNA (cytosine967-C5)-methyltransferase